MRLVSAVSATLCLLTGVGEGQDVHWVSPTTLYVVLIKFPDHPPHGYTRTVAADGTVSLRPGPSSYIDSRR